MTLTMKQSQAITDLAEHFYSFLPGKPHPYANQNISFPGVAAQLGLMNFWPAGSKMPAITTLLRNTLEQESNRFCPLVVGIVQSGMTYRTKNPISREEIDGINEAMQRIGYKIPNLHDPDFLRKLPRRGGGNASSEDAPDAKSIAKLNDELMALHTVEAVNRGFAFEKFLSQLFAVYDLAPRGSFRITGEQIDGSFTLDNEVYLLEARWRNEQAANGDLLTFSGKVGGKAEWARGLFVSYSGFSKDGLTGFGQGRRTNIIGIDGLDLHHILSGSLDFREVMRKKMRRAAETNRVHVPARELFSNLM